MSDNLISAAEAAKRLGVTRETIRAYVNSGLLPALKIGAKPLIKIRERDLNNYMTSSQVTPHMTAPYTGGAATAQSNAKPSNEGVPRPGIDWPVEKSAFDE